MPNELQPQQLAANSSNPQQHLHHSRLVFSGGGDNDHQQRKRTEEQLSTRQEVEEGTSQQVFLDARISSFNGVANIPSRYPPSMVMMTNSIEKTSHETCNSSNNQISSSMAKTITCINDVSLAESIREKEVDLGVHGKSMFDFGKENGNNLDNVESCGASPHKKSITNHDEEVEAVAEEETRNDDEENLFPISCVACRRGHKKCGRQLPVCLECKARGKVCQYPEPKKRGRTVGSKNKQPKRKSVTMTIMGIDSFKQKNAGYNITLSQFDTASINESQQFVIQQPPIPESNGKRTGSYENFQISSVKKKKIPKAKQTYNTSNELTTIQPPPPVNSSTSQPILNNDFDSTLFSNAPPFSFTPTPPNTNNGVELSVNTNQQQNIYHQRPPYQQFFIDNSSITNGMKNIQNLDADSLINLIRCALTTNCDQQTIETLLGLIIQNGNAGIVMPIINQMLIQKSRADFINIQTQPQNTSYNSPNNGSNNDIRESISSIPQVIDEAIYTTFERNTLLLPAILQQQTIELFFGMVSAGVPIITRDTFNKIIVNREAYGTMYQYTSLLYSIQSFCFQRAGNNTNSVRAFYRGKELLYVEYDYASQPSYLIAAICCYLGSFAAASNMNDEASSLVEATNKYLSSQTQLDESVMCLKRGYQLVLLILGDVDNEEQFIPNFLQKKLIEGYRYSSSQSVIPDNLNSIFKNPISHNTVPDYLHFVDAIEQEYNAYHSKKNIPERGRLLGNLLILISVSSYRILIFRELGFRGRALKQSAANLSNLAKNPLFPHIPAFLLTGLSKAWRSHVEAVEEIENDFFNGIPIDMQEFIYFHEMLSLDLCSANLIGKRFTKVFNAFGKIIQRMIDCTKRKSLILEKLKLTSSSHSIKLNLDLSSFE